MSTQSTQLKALRASIREIRHEMKAKGILKVSCFNAGLSPEEYRYNSQLFQLKTEIERLGK